MSGALAALPSYPCYATLLRPCRHSVTPLLSTRIVRYPQYRSIRLIARRSVHRSYHPTKARKDWEGSGEQKTKEPFEEDASTRSEAVIGSLGHQNPDGRACASNVERSPLLHSPKSPRFSYQNHRHGSRRIPDRNTYQHHHHNHSKPPISQPESASSRTLHASSSSTRRRRDKRIPSSSDASYQNISTEFHAEDIACKYHPPFAPSTISAAAFSSISARRRDETRRTQRSHEHCHPLSDPFVESTNSDRPRTARNQTSTPDIINGTNMSDEDYAAFLEKNSAEQPGGTASTQQTKPSSKSDSASTQDTDVPKALQHDSLKDRVYTSDADEPFQAVSLKWTGGESLSVGDVAGLAKAKDGDVQDVGVKGFDAQGEYKDVVDAVKKAAGGDVQVFRVEKSGARCEYWIVGVDGKGGRVVGFKVVSVES